MCHAQNVAEVLSPLLVLLILAFESLFHACGFEGAPVYRDTGILVGWRRGKSSRETASMLGILFVLRTCFGLAEVTARSRLGPILHQISTAKVASSSAENADLGKTSTALTRPRKRSSLFHLAMRFASTQLDDGRMQFTAAVMLVLQPTIFVFWGSRFARAHLS